MRTYTCTYLHACVGAHVHTYVYTYKHTHIHAHTNMHSYSHTDRPTDRLTDIQADINTHAHTHTYTSKQVLRNHITHADGTDFLATPRLVNPVSSVVFVLLGSAYFSTTNGRFGYKCCRWLATIDELRPSSARFGPGSPHIGQYWAQHCYLLSIWGRLWALGAVARQLSDNLLSIVVQSRSSPGSLGVAFRNVCRVSCR